MDIINKNLFKICERQIELKNGIENEYNVNLGRIQQLYLKALKTFSAEEPAAIVQQNNKRVKRLQNLPEEPEEVVELKSSPEVAEVAETTRRQSKKKSNIVEEDKENDEEQDSAVEVGPLRPVRTAKTKASSNLKELPCNVKMRNDNNKIEIKLEKEDTPVNRSIRPNKKKSDEGISSLASASETESAAKKRSNSLEIINAKPVEIELSSDDDAEKMPPPSMPAPKPQKKTRTKQKKISTSSTDSSSSVPAIPLRITRSKIKREPVDNFLVPAVPEKSVMEMSTNESSASTVVDEEKGKRRGRTKKKHVPIQVKQEKLDAAEATENAKNEAVESKEKEVVQTPEPIPVPVPQEPAKSGETEKKKSIQDDPQPVSPAIPPTVNSPVLDATFNVPGNTTFNIAVPAQSTMAVNDETVVIEPKDVRSSIMTEDDDDDLPIAAFKPPPVMPKPAVVKKPVMLGAHKKNEVFNPYVQSPVKKKVEAFEKHAYQYTPEKGKLVKSSSSGLPKSITPSSSRLAMLQATKTTPQATTSTSTMPKAASAIKTKPVKKMPTSKSLSQETLASEDARKKAWLQETKEERKRINEEKQRMAKLQREQLENQKREQTERLLKEREEKLKKAKAEKEERLKLEATKKKLLKEKQEKKYAEERKKEEGSAQKDTSLYIKMQKQVLKEKAEAEKREQARNLYHFDMLETDDSTDDESKPTTKRPPAPAWSQKQPRRLAIHQQSCIQADVIDALFAIKPMTVDLREIFPKIDQRKLARNSSAIWRTPPRYSEMPKY